MSYYERSGFKHLGESKAQFGGGGWHDMVGVSETGAAAFVYGL
jgi:hypothetical protein